MNTLRADFDQPLAAVHQTSSPVRAASQCVACRRWPSEVALGVHDRLRLAGGAARERDQAGVPAGSSSTAGAGSPANSASSGISSDRGLGGGPLELGAVALVGDDQRRAGHLDAQAQVLGAQLLGARQHDRADAKAGEHRQHPLRAVADQRHHHVALRHAVPLQRARQARRALGDLAEAPLAPGAVARELEQRELARAALEDVAVKFTPVFSLQPPKPTLER